MLSSDIGSPDIDGEGEIGSESHSSVPVFVTESFWRENVLGAGVVGQQQSSIHHVLVAQILKKSFLLLTLPHYVDFYRVKNDHL